MSDMYDQYNNLTRDEKKYLQSNPTHAFKIKEAKDLAYSETKKRFKINGKNDRSDAFRHCFWSAILAREIGYENALKFTTAHESYKGNPKDEKSMDLSNNLVGLRIGKRGGNNEHLSKLCYSAILNSELTIINNEN